MVRGAWKPLWAAWAGAWKTTQVPIRVWESQASWASGPKWPPPFFQIMISFSLLERQEACCCGARLQWSSNRTQLGDAGVLQAGSGALREGSGNQGIHWGRGLETEAQPVLHKAEGVSCPLSPEPLKSLPDFPYLTLVSFTAFVAPENIEANHWAAQGGA